MLHSAIVVLVDALEPSKQMSEHMSKHTCPNTHVQTHMSKHVSKHMSEPTWFLRSAVAVLVDALELPPQHVLIHCSPAIGSGAVGCTERKEAQIPLPKTKMSPRWHVLTHVFTRV